MTTETLGTEGDVTTGTETAQTASTGTSTTPVGASTSAGTFIDSLPEDLKGEASLANMKDLQSLAKSYVHSQKMLGNSVRIPGIDASDEAKKDFLDKITSVPGVVKLPSEGNKDELDAFYEKLGRPEDPAGYELPKPDYPIDEKATGEFKMLAHGLGLNKGQAKALYEFALARDEAILDAQEKSKEENRAILQREWGPEYKSRLQSVRAVLGVFEKRFPDAIKSLHESPALNNAGLLTMLSELGKMYAESGTIDAGQGLSFGMSSQEAVEAINEIRSNLKHPFYDGSDPGHEAAVEKMNRLSQIAYPTRRES